MKNKDDLLKRKREIAEAIGEADKLVESFRREIWVAADLAANLRRERKLIWDKLDELST